MTHQLDDPIDTLEKTHATLLRLSKALRKDSHAYQIAERAVAELYATRLALLEARDNVERRLAQRPRAESRLQEVASKNVRKASPRRRKKAAS